MMNKFVNDWLDSGFTEISGVKNEVRNENSLVPILCNESEENQTPKPLFSLFSSEAQLEPEFLPKYLSILESKFRHADSIKLDESKNDLDQEEKKKDAVEIERVVIDYNRKNIFLSRVMFNLFEMPDISVLKASEDYPKVLEKNQLYQNALERRRKYPESFKDQSAQTQFLDTVDCEIETDAIEYDSKSCLINNYVFKEHYFKSEMDSAPLPKTFTEFFEAKTKFCDNSEFLLAMSSFPSVCQRILDTLYVTEKVLDYNSFSDSILEFNGSGTDLYRAMTENLEVNDAHSPTAGLSNSVVVKCHLIFCLDKMEKDYIVTCVECNPHNPNIFVAGYGVPVDREMEYESRGMVLCWNINKCGYPEKIYYTEEIVTCLDFSKTEQYLVALGMRYGLIALYHLQRASLFASSDNYFSKTRPNGVMKSVRWFGKKFGMGEEIDKLLSVSSDGSICCWTPGKLLDGSKLRSIKRGDVKQLIEAGRRMVIAVDASGTCMEFRPDNEETFLVGTVEGEALLANINDPDHYRQVFKCHCGPLLDLQWSHFVPGVFMTTGTDRSIHIWEVGKKKPRKSLSLKEDVFRVVWSRTKSTLFATLSRNKMSVFDLAVDLHKEIASYAARGGTYFSCLNFCPRNNWLLVGTSDGSIELLELCNVPDPEPDQTQALRKTFITDD